MKYISTYLTCSFAFIVCGNIGGEQRFSTQADKKIEYVTIAILAKDKAHILPLYLSCIEKQTWPTEKTYLYVRTNNNNDATATLLKLWLARVQNRYAGVYFDESDVPEQVQKYGQHEWNSERFKVLGKIRQDSLNWAHEHKSHYFVADCDNLLQPHTLASLVATGLPIVAPLLRTGNNLYSNYHAAIDEHGYYRHCPLYMQLLEQEIEGLIEVPVVHCTYLIRWDMLDKLSYDDGTGRYEYVIFSDSARKQGVSQYLDTRDMYGRISFAETGAQLQQEPWLREFLGTPRVSAITSLYKGAEYIQGFLEDIVKQTLFEQSEYIIINANSPEYEKEESYIYEYLVKYPNIRYWRIDTDPGIYGVWNMAIKVALGDFITNLNLDDRRNPYSFEIAATELACHRSIDLVYSNYLITGNPNETWEDNHSRGMVVLPDFDSHEMKVCLPGPMPMWRKSLHTKYGFFDENFLMAGDWEMWLRAVSKGAIMKRIRSFIAGLYYENPTGLSTAHWDDPSDPKSQIRDKERSRIEKEYSYLWS